MIAIVIPTYNEALNIQKLIPIIGKRLKSLDYRVIVADDDSPDGTWRIAQELSKTYPITVLHRKKNRGYGEACKDGFRQALKEGADYIVTMDCDLSHNVEVVPSMIEKTESDSVDVVVGSRYTKGGQIKNWPFSRKVYSRGANLLTRWLLWLPVKDTTSGYRCYKRKVLESIDLTKIRSNGYAFLEELLFACRQSGFRLGEVPIEFIDRKHGYSKLSKKEFLSFLLTIFRLHFSSFAVVWILLFAFLVRFVGVFQGLPYWIHSDEANTIYRSLKFGTGDFNPHFFDWPANLLMYVLFFAYSAYFVLGKFLGLFAGVSDFVFLFLNNPSSFLFIGRLVVVFFGVANVFVVYKCGKQLFNKKVGLIAALFLSLAWVHVERGQHALADVPMTFFMTLSFLFASKILSEKRWRNYILAGLFAGFAVSMKYYGGLVIVTLPIAHLLAQKKFNFNCILDKKLLFGCAMLILGFVIGTPFALVSFREFYTDISAVIGMRTLQSFTPLPETLGIIVKLARQSMGEVLAGAAFLGILTLVAKRSKSSFLLISYPLIHFLIFSLNKLKVIRYFVPPMPFLALAGAVFVYEVGKRLPKKARIVFGIILLLQPVAIIAQHDWLLLQKSTDRLTREWVEANIPSGAKIAVDSFGPILPESRESVLKRKTLTETREPGAIFKYREFISQKPELSVSYQVYDILIEWEPYPNDPFHQRLKNTNPFPKLVEQGIEYVITDGHSKAEKTGDKTELKMFHTKYWSDSELLPVEESIENVAKVYADIEKYGIKIFEINASKEHLGPTIQVFKLEYSKLEEDGALLG